MTLSYVGVLLPTFQLTLIPVVLLRNILGRPDQQKQAGLFELCSILLC